ncbi:MAG: hypothetical protein LBS82_03225, partial [Spirochaetaceae bacterium]|nr:hypothetical protein [Spirochaetaceae bacterium]
MGMMTAEQAAEQARGLTFEKVWAAMMESRARMEAMSQETDKKFQEMAEQMKETDKQIKETAEQMKETDKQIKEMVEQSKKTEETMDKLGKNMGGNNRSIG